MAGKVGEGGATGEVGAAGEVGAVGEVGAAGGCVITHSAEDCLGNHTCFKYVVFLVEDIVKISRERSSQAYIGCVNNRTLLTEKEKNTFNRDTL